jgi:hypothetical protein
MRQKSPPENTGKKVTLTQAFCFVRFRAFLAH